MKRQVQRQSLAQANPEGRLDVLLYQLAGRVMEGIEAQHQLVGIRDNLLPMVEEVIFATLPRENLIPRELRPFLRVWQQNRGRAWR